MRRLPLVTLGTLTAIAALNIATFAGCGSDDGVDIGDGGSADATLDDGNSNGDTGSSGSNDGSGGDGGFIDVITKDSSALADAPVCKLVGQSCTTSVDCCTANCEKEGGAAGVCAPPTSTCKLPGTACAAGPECCTGACIGGTCSNKACVPDTPPGACASNAECCGGNCKPDGTGGGLCQPANPGGGCKTSGNPCATNGDCCSKFCNAGFCSGAVSFCAQKGEICAKNSDCCGGNCLPPPAGGGLGVCGDPTGTGVGGCQPAGVVCQPGADGGTQCEQSCCSRSCGPFGGLSGFKVCQPPSGCRPKGEICLGTSDCCGAPGSPPPTGGPAASCNKTAGAVFGRCDEGGGCREPGAICKAGGALSCSTQNDCCEPPGLPNGVNCNNTPEACCKQDALGIPRCIVAPLDCAVAKPPPGSTCATSADCCGDPCVGNVCLGACVPSGGTCTTTADCCTGMPCVTPPGSTKGVCNGVLAPDGGVSPPPDGGADGGGGGGNQDAAVCALFGQACMETAECCNGVPCTSGRCRFP